MKVCATPGCNAPANSMHESGLCSGCLQQKQQAGPRQDLVRVLRIVEYIGARSAVEAQIANSIHGEKTYGGVLASNANAPQGYPSWTTTGGAGGWTSVTTSGVSMPVRIRATTLGTFPDLLEAAVLEQALRGEPTEKDLRIQQLERELEAERASGAMQAQMRNAAQRQTSIQNSHLSNALGNWSRLDAASLTQGLDIPDSFKEIEAEMKAFDERIEKRNSLFQKAKAKLGL